MSSAGKSSTNEGAPAKSRESKRQRNAEWEARRKEKELKVLAAVNKKLARLNRPSVTLKVHRQPCSFKGKKRPDYMPPPEVAAKMSPSELKAWRAEQNRKRKALKQREYRAKRKKIFKGIQSMLITLPSVEVAVSEKNEGSGSNKDSDAGAGNVQVVNGVDKAGMVLGITSSHGGYKEGSKKSIEGVNIVSNDGIGAGKSHHCDGKVNILGANPAPARSEEPRKILSEECDSDLLIDMIGEVEGVYVPAEEFDGLFYPVDTNEENDGHDISVFGDSSLDYQLPL